MYDSPVSLQECCVDFICENIVAICDVQTSPEDQQPRYTFRDPDVFFHTEVSQQVLETLGNRGQLNDVVLSLFDSRVTRLQKVHLRKASNVTTRGLRVLRSHQLTEIEATGLTKVTVNDLIGCLGDWTLTHLRTLNVARCAFTSAKLCVVVALSKLRNLSSLNVSHTEFNRHGLDIVTQDLPHLEALDISATRVKDISPLLKCRDKLRSLSMYNLKALSCEEVVPVLVQLEQLRHLDVSVDRDHPLDLLNPLRYDVSPLLKDPTRLPHLLSLDVSGKDGLTIHTLVDFLKAHPKLNFLGLMQTDICFDDYFTRQLPQSRDITITGSANEQQILDSLRRYTDRQFYVQKSLYYLYSYTQNYSQPRVDIIKLILPGMGEHSKVLGIQMAATACLYNLSKSTLGQKIHPHWLRKIVMLTLAAMENFPRHQQLQKNTLLTLCSDRILQDVTFDRYHCAKLVMDSLVVFDDPSMNRMSVAICSILAAKISTSETSALGAKPQYMERLLKIVQSKLYVGEVDIMMKFTLSALWNLTDESPKTCSVFLSMGGMDLFLHVLELFIGENAVETKVLGLVNNIAEVPHLRRDLLTDNFLGILIKLLHSSHIDVSYFAAGIVAHLASDGPDRWTVTCVSLDEMLTELGQVVQSWKSPETEMVAYRSFNPFFPLLRCPNAYQVQLWAVWAMHHVCSKNPKRYCSMLLQEGGTNVLRDILSNPSTHPMVLQICHNILTLVDGHREATAMTQGMMPDMCTL
ncbi:protein zyg-11 homolog B-like [Ornithodoros turicata]|uniref:Putative cul2-ring ubiquitin ligase complex n=1 Tax=Ornithodoros turicata TaxID=34597 RepID=A0A2R5L8K9_9ACAR